MSPSQVVLRAHFLRERLRNAVLGWIVRRKLDRMMHRLGDQAAHVEVADCLREIERFEPTGWEKAGLVAHYRYLARRGLKALRRTSCGRAS
jgi:hypothetical protein